MSNQINYVRPTEQPLYEGMTRLRGRGYQVTANRSLRQVLETLLEQL